MIHLTENEKTLLKSFALSEYNSRNGDAIEKETTTSEVMTFVFLEMHEVNGLTVRQKKGVLSSLVKKNLVSVYEERGEPDHLDFTDLGLETVKELFGLK